MVSKSDMFRTHHPLTNRFVGAKNLRGENLTHWCFLGSDVRGADLSGTSGDFADFRCALMDDADLSGVNMSRWLLTGASMRGVNLTGAVIDFGTHMEGVDLTGAVYGDTRILVNGWRSRGMVTSAFDPAGIVEGYDNNWLAGRLMLTAAEGDEEIKDVARFIMATGVADFGYAPCWEGFAQFVEARYPHRRDDLLAICRTYPAWLMEERWEFAEAIIQANPTTVEAWTALRQHKFGELFSSLIDRRIAGLRKK